MSFFFPLYCMLLLKIIYFSKTVLYIPGLVTLFLIDFYYFSMKTLGKQTPKLIKYENSYIKDINSYGCQSFI